MNQTNNTINIKKARAKNFFSIGNSFMEFDYSTYSSTLIIGKNGSGKSSSGPDIICYGLFGKPYRDIKLAQVINSINNKHMVVEIEFSVFGIEYKIVRGMKPAIFEIYKNGELITQESATRDYQKILEVQILKMNIKTFKQLVAIGAATYTPFMQLKAAERRQIIEDILDISIFSKMGELSRNKERVIKADISRINSELELRRTSVVDSRNNLAVLLEDKKKQDDTRNTVIERLNSSLISEQTRLKELIVSIGELKEKTADYAKLTDSKSKLDRSIIQFENKILTIQSQVSNIEKDTVCSSCSQEIPESSRKSAIDRLLPGLDTNTNSLNEYSNIRDKLDIKIDSLKESVNQLNDFTNESRLIAANIKSITEQLGEWQSSDNAFDAILSLQDSIVKYNGIVESLSSESAKIGEELQYYSIVSSMLKDSGIKSTIVANYLPVINKLINHYLEEFGLFVGFELSSTFEETIKARHRDTYTYNSFSEGEKSAIDLSILFAWRHISQLKSTMSCNLLFLDEIGGSSLDLDNMAVMVESVCKTAKNVFLITHREVEEEIFDRVWEFAKPGNFTEFKVRYN